METTTSRPPSPGDGKGQSKTSPKPRPETEAAEPAAPLPEGSRAKPGTSLLGADGQTVRISEDPAETAADRGRELGRRAADSWERLSDSWERLSSAASDLAERNPTRTALASLGVGILIGAVVGAILARD
jgi:hypothetical protein